MMMGEPLKLGRRQRGQPVLIDALAELRRQAAREGHCALHVQSITFAIDQYAGAALGNRDYCLNKPCGIGSSRKSAPLIELAHVGSSVRRAISRKRFLEGQD